MKITDDIKYVGVNDKIIDLFEGQFPVPDGMKYNSYLIIDQKTAVIDSVDRHFTDEWLDNIEKVSRGKAPDYLIIQHMEPDHSSGIAAFAAKYPEAVIVSSSRAFTMIRQYFATDYTDRRIVVGENDTLPLGRHTLTFIGALTERGFKKKTVGFIENGSWAPAATRIMKQMLENSKDINYTEATVKIMSALTDEDRVNINALAAELAK